MKRCTYSGCLALMIAFILVSLLVKPAQARQAQPGTTSATPTATVPLLFSDGFETEDLTQWTGKSGLAVQQGHVFADAFAARATSNGQPAFARKDLSGTQPEIYYRLRLKLLAQDPTNPIHVLGFRTDTNASLLDVFVNSNGRLGYTNDVSGITTESPTLVNRDVWQELQVRVRIADAASQVEVWLNGARIADLSRTVALGTASIGRIQLGESLPGRSFDVAFDDVLVATTYIPSSQKPDPLIVTIETVPPTAGVQFSFQDQIVVSDAQGIARIATAQLTDLRTRIKIITSDVGNGIRAEFGRWFWSQVKTEARVGLDLNYPMTWTFADLQGQSVAPDRITSMTMKSSVGEIQTFNTEQIKQQQWLWGSRIVPTISGLLQKEIYYTIESVMINGTNVVNRSQQRFFPSRERSRQFQLMFFSARFSARDALFGFPIGTGIRLEYPDGSTRTIPFNTSDDLVLTLPRGEYRVSVVGPGLSPPRPLALSRDQIVQLDLISQVDIAVVSVVLAALGLGLLLFGRPQLVRGLHGGRRRGWGYQGGVIGQRLSRGHVLSLLTTAAISSGVTVIILQVGPSVSWASGSVQLPTNASSSTAASAYARSGNAAIASKPALPSVAPIIPTAALPVMAQIRPPATPDQSATSSGSPEHMPAASPRMYVVQPGDTIARLAARFYGTAEAWPRIYEANRASIKDPREIVVGQELVIPDE